MSVRLTGSIDFGRARVSVQVEHPSGEIAAHLYLQVLNAMERDRAAREEPAARDAT